MPKQAAGRAGQLAVRGRGEGRGTLVADADVGQLAALLGLTEGVRQAEVGVADHAEHGGHAPVDQGLRHQVADRGGVDGRLLHRDVDAVVALLDRVGGHAVVVGAGRPAAQRVEVPAVPGAAQPAVAGLVALDAALAQRPALVRAGVLECPDLALVPGQRDRLAASLHREHAALARLAGHGDLVPDRLQTILGIKRFLGDRLVRAVAQRRIGAALAQAEEDLAVLVGGVLRAARSRYPCASRHRTAGPWNGRNCTTRRSVTAFISTGLGPGVRDIGFVHRLGPPLGCLRRDCPHRAWRCAADRPGAAAGTTGHDYSSPGPAGSPPDGVAPTAWPVGGMACIIHSAGT
jgi:hypothetical protein